LGENKFGGPWTIEKLDILSKYLNAYAQALKEQLFNIIYIDAFAGNGKIDIDGQEEQIEGSVRLALNAENKFDKYIFIEKKKAFANDLQKIVSDEYSNFKDIVKIINGDCNDEIIKLCKEIDWKTNRAVLFLDPYSMQVNWNTLEVIANTQAVDVWYLFPLGASNRLLKKDGSNIDKTWKNKLNSIFGDEYWFERFYMENPQMSFFQKEKPDYIKIANTFEIVNYIKERLSTSFSFVANNPKILYNSKNSPLFLFCFAMSNKSGKAIGLAQRFANYILGDRGDYDV